MSSFNDVIHPARHALDQRPQVPNLLNTELLEGLTRISTGANCLKKTQENSRVGAAHPRMA